MLIDAQITNFEQITISEYSFFIKLEKKYFFKYYCV